MSNEYFLQLVSENDLLVQKTIKRLQNHICALYRQEPEGDLHTRLIRKAWGIHLVRQHDNHGILKTFGPNFIKQNLTELMYLFDKWKISDKIHHCKFFVGRPRKIGIVHIDGDYRKCAINIPVFGAERGFIEWFKNERFTGTVIHEKHTIITLPNSSEARRTKELPDEKARTAGIQLINTGVWHRVNNSDNDKFRLVFSIRFNDNPSFEEMSEILKNDSLQSTVDN